MFLGYTWCFIYGVHSFINESKCPWVVMLLFEVYTNDVFFCCCGIRCMGSIPAQNVILHHVPVLGMLLRFMIIYHTELLSRVQMSTIHDLGISITPITSEEMSLINLVISSVSSTSVNEALWVGTHFLSRETLAGYTYRKFHACVTTAVLAQVIVILSYVCVRLLQISDTFNVDCAMAIISLRYIQIPLFINASKRAWSI